MTSTVVSIGSAVVAAMWASVLDATLFAVLVAAAVRFAKPNASARHLLSWLVLVLALSVPIASLSASLGRVRTIVEATPLRAQSAGAPRTIAPAGRRKTTTTNAAAGVVAPEIDLTIPRSFLVGSALAIWSAIALYKMVALGVELLALRSVKRRARQLDRATLSALRVWNANAGAMRAASIAISNDVDVPCAAGLWAPAILLPEHVVASQRADDIDRIVMHEAAHLARYDDWTNVLERVFGAVLWFNPALAFARRRIAIDREIACDDWVVARMGGAHGYASCLFRLAEATRGARPVVHALGALGNARHITQRIEHLLANPKSHGRRAARTLLAALGIAGLALTIVQAAQAPAIAIDRAAPEAPTAPSIPAAPPQTPARPAVGIITRTVHRSVARLTHERAARIVAPVPPIAAVTPGAAVRVRHAAAVATAPLPPLTPSVRIADDLSARPIPPAPPALPTFSPRDDANLRSKEAQLHADAAALSQAARALALREIERARAEMSRQPQPFADLGLSAAAEALRASLGVSQHEALQDAARVKNEAMREREQGVREAAQARAQAARERAEALRESTRETLQAKAEALRESVEAIRESNRNLQEMREELQRENLQEGTP